MRFGVAGFEIWTDIEDPFARMKPSDPQSSRIFRCTLEGCILQALPQVQTRACKLLPPQNRTEPARVADHASFQSEHIRSTSITRTGNPTSHTPGTIPSQRHIGNWQSGLWPHRVPGSWLLGCSFMFYVTLCYIRYYVRSPGWYKGSPCLLRISR